jgi:hypothetical protein
MRCVYGLKDQQGRWQGFVKANSDTEARQLFGRPSVGMPIERLPYPGNEYVALENSRKKITELLSQLEEATIQR